MVPFDYRMFICPVLTAMSADTPTVCSSRCGLTLPGLCHGQPYADTDKQLFRSFHSNSVVSLL